jgi:hypothetical protein
MVNFFGSWLAVTVGVGLAGWLILPLQEHVGIPLICVGVAGVLLGLFLAVIVFVLFLRRKK